MSALLLALVVIPGESGCQACEVELHVALWWVERGFWPWSGRSLLGGPARRQPAFDEPDVGLPPG